MIKRVILALFLGAIAVFAFAPFNIWILSFISYLGLIALIADLSAKKAAGVAFCWGFGFFGAGVHWIYVSLLQYGNFSAVVAVIIVCLFVCYLALYPALFAYLLQRLSKPYSFIQLVIAVPALWQLTEFLRGWILNGFAWLQLGYSQLNSPLRVFIPIFGVLFLNLLIPLLCGLILYLFHRRKSLSRQDAFIVIGSTLGFILIVWAGSFISWTKTDSSRSATFALIQGNVKQSIKWSPKQLDKTLSDYARLTEDYLPISNIIIWPEAAVTDTESSQQQYLKQLDKRARQFHSSIAVGIIDSQTKWGKTEIFNSLITLGNNIPYHYPENNRYNKRHLVPFGEYVPLRSLLAPIARLLNIPMASMSAGADPQPQLKMQGFNFATVICYEIILPELVWSAYTQDTDFLLTVSNDAWFGDSIAPWQHLQMAQARAMEFGRPLLRSTNDGITVAVDHHGMILKQLPQFKQGVLTITLSPTQGQTPFSIWGTSIYWLITLMFMVLTLLNLRKTKKKESNSLKDH